MFWLRLDWVVGFEFELVKEGLVLILRVVVVVGCLTERGPLLPHHGHHVCRVTLSYFCTCIALIDLVGFGLGIFAIFVICFRWYTATEAFFPGWWVFKDDGSYAFIYELLSLFYLFLLSSVCQGTLESFLILGLGDGVRGGLDEGAGIVIILRLFYWSRNTLSLFEPLENCKSR